MLSKNNKKLQAQKMEPKQQRFAIKKFTVGVASVLVGTTFALYSGVGSVSANETATQEATAEVVEDNVADQTDDKERVFIRLCLRFGFTIRTISKKTGYAEKTIRNEYSYSRHMHATKRNSYVIVKDKAPGSSARQPLSHYLKSKEGNERYCLNRRQ